MTTGEQSGSSKSEIVDLQNPNSKCKDWANYPLVGLYDATGQVIGNHVYICGGYIWTHGHRSNCYKIGPESAVALPSLSNVRDDAASGVFNNALFVTGGDRSGYLNATEYISEDKQQNGVSMPVKVENHCVIQVNLNEILVTGGNGANGPRKDTYFFKNDLQQWEKGPQMAISRYFHGCGSFYLKSKLVLIVAGGQTVNSVEFLLPNETEPKWIAGTNLFTNDF